MTVGRPADRTVEARADHKVTVMSAPPLPTPETRWRCTRCGNLTRFDVTRTFRVLEFVHVDLAGEQAVDERDVLHEVVEHVRCRWCDCTDCVELVPRPVRGMEQAQ